MQERPDADGGDLAGAHGAAGGLVCDFCGERVPSVRRVALDREYDRLATPHRELYACPACSERKDRERLGMAPRR